MNLLNQLMRQFFFLLTRGFILLLLGFNVRNRELLPKRGPAIIVANHNSHLDTLVLMSLFPLRQLPKIRAVAAADYFLKNRFLAWFATRLIGIIPIERGKASKVFDPLRPVYDALDREEIVILFPEGTRGEPEHVSEFKKGVSYLAERFPKVSVVPLFLHGLGKTLPKGEFILVPFFCDVFVGESFTFHIDKNLFMNTLNERFEKLSKEGQFGAWD